MDISIRNKSSTKTYLKCLKKYSYEERNLISRGRKVERTPLDKPEIQKRDGVKLEIILGEFHPFKKETYRFKYCGCKLPFFSEKINCKYWLEIGKLNPDYLVNHRKRNFWRYEAQPARIVKKK